MKKLMFIFLLCVSTIYAQEIPSLVKPPEAGAVYRLAQEGIIESESLSEPELREDLSYKEASSLLRDLGSGL